MPEAVQPLLSPEEIEQVPCLKEHLDKLNESFLNVKSREELEKVFREIVMTLRALVRKKIVQIAFSNRVTHFTPARPNPFDTCSPRIEASTVVLEDVIQFDILSRLFLGRGEIYASGFVNGYDKKEKILSFVPKSKKSSTPDTDRFGYFSLREVKFGDGNIGVCEKVSSQELMVQGIIEGIIDKVFSRVRKKLQAIVAAENREQKNVLKQKEAVLQLPPKDKTIKNRNSPEGDKDYMRRLWAGKIKLSL